MEDNFKYLEQLALLKENQFREDQLEKLGINYTAREDLERKGFLTVDRSKPYPQWVFYLSGFAYEFINARKAREENVIIGKENLLWQKWGIFITIFSLVVAILALIVTVLPYFKA